DQDVVKRRVAVTRHQTHAAVVHQVVVVEAQHALSIEHHIHSVGGAFAESHQQGVVGTDADGCAGNRIDVPGSATAVTKYDLIGTGDYSRVEEVVRRRVAKCEPGIDPRLAGVYRGGVFDIGQRRDGERTHGQSRVVQWRRREVGATGAIGRRPCPGR